MPTPPDGGELGAWLGLSSGSVTALVDRLERAGHVERVRDHTDRRRVSLRATMASRDPAELEVIAAFRSEAVAAERTVR